VREPAYRAKLRGRQASHARRRLLLSLSPRTDRFGASQTGGLMSPGATSREPRLDFSSSRDKCTTPFSTSCLNDTLRIFAFDGPLRGAAA
jgi:hypothetical protein